MRKSATNSKGIPIDHFNRNFYAKLTNFASLITKLNTIRFECKRSRLCFCLEKKFQSQRNLRVIYAAQLYWQMISLNKKKKISISKKMNWNRSLFWSILRFYWIDILYILCVLFLVVFDSRFNDATGFLNKVNLIWNLELVELRLVLIFKQ